MRELTRRRDPDTQSLLGFGCSECDWLFALWRDDRDKGPPSVQEVVTTFERHDCAQHTASNAA